MSLCKYKNVFGQEKTGVHSYRFFDIAIMDVLMTIAGAMLISFFTNYRFIYVLLTLFILGIILHRLFCVKTTVDKLLFSS
jgi:hypothetical protein